MTDIQTEEAQRQITMPQTAKCQMVKKEWNILRITKMWLKKNTEQKGSVTIYLVMTLVLILAVVFSMLEALRTEQLNLLAEENAQQIMESVFSQYDKEIFERYQLFFYELPKGDEADFSKVYDTAERVSSSAFAPHASGKNAFLYRGTLSDAKVDSYELATDENGQAFIRQAVECAKERVPTDALEKLAGLLEETCRQEEQTGSFSDIEKNAVDAIAKTDKKSQEKSTSGSSPAAQNKNTSDSSTVSESAGTKTDSTVIKKYGNPLESMQNIKKTGILSLVVNPQKEVSASSLEKEKMLTKRTLDTGTAVKEDRNIVDKVWLLRYIDQYFSDFTGAAGNALAYEKEFIVIGKNSDTENMKAVVNRLLLLREACNYVSIKQDVKKCELALTIAASICGVTGTSVLTTAVQQGILLAWAYGESILDVRTLLEGGKISFFKTEAEWTLELEQLKKVNNSWLTAKESGTGMDYSSYLDLFLLLQSPETIAMRSLTIIESSVQMQEGKEHVRMDRMISAMECTFTYEAKPLFLQFVPQLKNRVSGYYMAKKEKYSY